ncbi:MAG: hypothetical protein LBF58_08715 [Deltaproteobacteria bacterium]|jgi:hypothetical protein|nr:hypothetical protein [Deltaproteobacteria bacterium]
MPPSKGLDEATILSRLLSLCPDYPQAVTSTAMELILASARESLAQGRAVTLRSFGRLIPRRYHSSGPKKFGLVFRASPKLNRRLNPATPKAPDEPGF